MTATLTDGFYGAAFDFANPLSLKNPTKNYKEKGIKDAKISGTIAQVCQSKGCWF